MPKMLTVWTAFRRRSRVVVLDIKFCVWFAISDRNLVIFMGFFSGNKAILALKFTAHFMHGFISEHGNPRSKHIFIEQHICCLQLTPATVQTAIHQNSALPLKIQGNKHECSVALCRRLASIYIKSGTRMFVCVNHPQPFNRAFVLPTLLRR